jgi:hypothetical protein
VERVNLIERFVWDNVVLVTRDGLVDQTWDGKIKNLIYDTDSMSWIAQTSSVGGGGSGGGDASASNQLTEIARLTSINNKIPALLSSSPLIDSGESATPVRIISQTKAEFIIEKDEDTTNEIYFGYAIPGTLTSNSSWKIKKLTKTGSDFNVKYANGSANFTNKWSDRLSLSYS